MADSPDEKLFPAKVAAGFLTLVVLVGLFFVTLVRGPNVLYTVVVGVVTAGLAVLLAVLLVRRHRRRKLGLDQLDDLRTR